MADRSPAEVVIHVGADGGSFTLFRRRSPDDGGWRYYTERDEGSLQEFCDVELTDEEKFGRSREVPTFAEGLSLMDEYPYWCKLYALEVHPEFRDAVLEIVEARLGTAPEEGHDRYALDQWRSVTVGGARTVTDANPGLLGALGEGDPAHPATLDELRSRTREPTWVSVAGYALEKIHTGVLVHALSGQSEHAAPLAVALWHRAGGEALDPAQVTGIKADVEVSVGKGRDSVLDLLVSFKVHGQLHRVGIELKVDSSPRWQQLVNLRDGLERDKTVRSRMVLLALGAAHVCRCEGSPKGHSLPPGVTRWSIGEILSLRPMILAAANDESGKWTAIVEDWLHELETETVRSHIAMEVPDHEHKRLGYRSRTLETYRLARLAELFERAGAGPWEVAIHSYNVVANGKESWRAISGTGENPANVFLEVTQGAICVKAGRWPKGPDLRKTAAPVEEQARLAFTKAGLRVKKAKVTAGDFSITLLKVPLALDKPSDAAETVVRVVEAWKGIW